MQVYDSNNLPKDIELSDVILSEITSDNPDKLMAKVESKIHKHHIFDEGFKTENNEVILKKTEKSTVKGAEIDRNYLVIDQEQNRIFTSLPFPEGLSLSEVNFFGHFNNQICMLGAKGGKCFVMNGYNKPIVDAEIKYSSFK
jgi:hypothetical protein